MTHCSYQGQCIGLKVVFLAGKFVFVRSDTFAVGCIIEPENAREK